MFKNNKGVTLVELIIILSLIGIIITPIFSFLISNLKAFNREDIELELSYQAESVLNRIVNESIVFKRINDIKGNVSQNKINATEISFVDYNNNVKIFKLINNSLKYNNVEIGKYIEDFYIELIPKNTDIKNADEAKGLKCTIKFKKDNIENEVSTQIFLRNKK